MPKEILKQNKSKIIKSINKNLMITDKIKDGVKCVDCVMTDAWVSMGESSSKKKYFKNYQVNSEVIKVANKDVDKNIARIASDFFTSITKGGVPVYDIMRELYSKYGDASNEKKQLDEIGNEDIKIMHVAEENSKCTITLISKNDINEGNTRYAQGGIAVVRNLKKDSTEKHIKDTLLAGDEGCDPDVVKFVVEEANLRLDELIKWGTAFDKKKEKLHLAMEGGHSENRIVHYKDQTGKQGY